MLKAWLTADCNQIKTGERMKKKHASIRGVIARETIRFAMSTPKLKNGGLFKVGAALTGRASKWTCPKGFGIRKIDCCGAPAEFLEPDSGLKDKVILQLHGGAYLIGFLDMYRKFACRYAKLSGGASVLSLDYRIAPEYQYPAALDDAMNAWTWLLDHHYRAENIILAGDSAGGNLALALTLKLRESGRALPNALVLMSPWADMTGKGASRTLNFRKDPMFGKRAGDGGPDDKRKPGNPYAGQADLYDAHLSPVFADFTGFPTMLIQAGDWEMLFDDARTVAEKAWSAKVDATLMVYPGMFHVFQSLYFLPESKDAWKAAGDFIRKRFGPCPSGWQHT
jgi:monoterpene epsilon-lactone hydrolase